MHTHAHTHRPYPQSPPPPSQVWNKLNSTVPAAVAYPADADQVAAAVKCAKAAGIKPVPRSALPPAVSSLPTSNVPLLLFAADN